MAKKSNRASKIIPERIMDWSGGQNNAVNVALLNDNESRLLQNYSLDEKGTLFPFPGSLKRYASDLGSLPVAGMGKLYKSDGTSRLLIGLEDGKLYVDSPHLVNQYDTQAEFNGGGNFGVQADANGKLWPTIIKDGFESGLFDDWHTHDSGWAIDSTVFKTGTKSAKGTGNTQKLAREFGFNASHFYIKLAVRFNENNLYHYPLGLVSSSGSIAYLVAGHSDGHLKYYNGSAYANFPTDKTYAANTWYVVEVFVRNGLFWVIIDGQRLNTDGIAIKDTNNSAQTLFSKFQAISSDTTGTIWVDDIEINLLTPVFSRGSVAYKKDGTQVVANAPRYEAGQAGFGQALMVEEETTNSALYSQDLDNAVWNKTTHPCSVTANQATAPDGTSTMDKITATGGSNKHAVVQIIAGGIAGQTYTISAYGKKDTSDYLVIGDRNDSVWRYGVFNLATGQYVGAQSIGITTTKVEDLGSGIFKCSISYTRSYTSDIQVMVGVGQSGTGKADYSPSVTPESIYAWRVQLEQKAYPTSSLKVDGTAVIRSPEVPTIPTAGVLNPQEGTWEQRVYVDSVAKRQISGMWPTVFYIPRADGNTGIWVYHATNSALWTIQTQDNGGQVSAASCSDSYTPDGWHRFSVVWNAGEIALLIDGVRRITIANPYMPTGFAASAYIGSYAGSNNFLNTLHDDLRISSIARTDQEIADAEASGLPLPVDVNTTYKMAFDGNLDVSATHHWLSPAIDCSNATDQLSGHAALTTITPGASNVTVYSRSAPASTGPWTAWVAALGDGSLQHAADDFIQVKLILARDGENDPYVDSLTVSFDGQATATLLASDFSPGKQFFFDQLNDLLAVMTGDAPRKYDGTTLAAMGGSPPHAPYGVAHKNRFWMAKGSRLYFSDLLNVESWPVLNFIDIMPNDGDIITGMITFGDYLVIAKGHSVWMLIGETINTFRVRRIHSDRGCYAPRSLCIVNQMLCFVSDDGIYFSDFTQPVLISERIRKTWDGLNKRRLNLIASWFFDHKLYVAVPDAGQQRNNRVLVYDSLRQAFAGDRMWPVSCWTDFREAGEINSFFGRSDLGNVRKINTGYNDDGAAYEVIYESKAISHGAPEILKRYNIGYLQVKPAALDAELIISFIVDGVETPTMTVPVPANVTGLIDTLQIFASEVGVVSGHRIQVKIRQQVLDNPLGIQSVYLEALPLLIAPTLRG